MSNVNNFFEQPSDTLGKDNVLNIEGTSKVNGQEFTSEEFREGLLVGVWRYKAAAGDISTLGANIIGVTDTSAPRLITISSADILIPGMLFSIQDESGGAGTNNITIGTEGSETISGQPTITISANFGRAMVYSNGSNLFA